MRVLSFNDVTHIPAPYMYPGFDTIKYMQDLLDDDHSGIEKPAALVIETVQAEGGIHVLDVEWLKAARKFCDDNDIVLIVDDIHITVPVALHLDHGSYEGAKACIKAGFSSIMFDGSHYPIEENIAKTKELVATCNILGLSLEAEVGAIGGEEDGVVGMGECADPKECKMVADLGVTMLAAGIGNIHGKYPANWKGLSFETLDAIQQLTGEMPLVLHGGTGIPADMIKKAISLGVSKINVNTECQLAFADATYYRIGFYLMREYAKLFCHSCGG